MDRPEFLEGGERARLIPVAADGSREARAASILLATLLGVPPYAKQMLGLLGQRVGSRAALECFTEVVFCKNGGGETGCRPDGLILLDGGRGRQWSCLVEAKIGRAEIDGEQLARYMAVARANGVSAVLTISNQFVALPTHSPVRLPKSATKGIATFHWSWMAVLTNALLLLNEHDFERVEQRFILEEMVRHFSHPSASISTFDRMNAEWKELNGKVVAGARLARSAPEVEKSVAAWHQESRDLTLLMSRELKRAVRQRLSRAHAEDPVLRVKDDAEHLVGEQALRCVLEVPDAAAPLQIVADLRRRCLAVSMALTAPRDKQRASSRISWLLRQLAKAEPADIHVRALWPGRAPATQAPLAALRENPALLESGNRSLAPTQFEVLLVRDLGAKFAGTRTFIEQLELAVPHFYEQVGQHLRAYVVAPPRLKREEVGEDRADEAAEREGEVASAEKVEAGRCL